MGGARGHKGGFASRPDLARAAGAKGGKVSRRNVEVANKIREHKDEILALHKEGTPCTIISKKLDIPCESLRYWIRRYAGER